MSLIVRSRPGGWALTPALLAQFALPHETGGRARIVVASEPVACAVPWYPAPCSLSGIWVIAERDLDDFLDSPAEWLLAAHLQAIGRDRGGLHSTFWEDVSAKAVPSAQQERSLRLSDQQRREWARRGLTMQNHLSTGYGRWSIRKMRELEQRLDEIQALLGARGLDFLLQAHSLTA